MPQGSLVIRLSSLAPKDDAFLQFQLRSPPLGQGPVVPFSEAVFLLPSFPGDLCGHLPSVDRSPGPGRQGCLCGMAPPPTRCGIQPLGTQQPLSDSVASRVTAPCCMAAVATLMASSKVCWSSSCGEGGREAKRE